MKLGAVGPLCLVGLELPAWGLKGLRRGFLCQRDGQAWCAHGCCRLCSVSSACPVVCGPAPALVRRHRKVCPGEFLFRCTRALTWGTYRSYHPEALCFSLVSCWDRWPSRRWRGHPLSLRCLFHWLLCLWPHLNRGAPCSTPSPHSPGGLPTVLFAPAPFRLWVSGLPKEGRSVPQPTMTDASVLFLPRFASLRDLCFWAHQGKARTCCWAGRSALEGPALHLSSPSGSLGVTATRAVFLKQAWPCYFPAY